MIAKLTGKVDTLLKDSLILDVQGVGYQVFCSLPTLAWCQEKRELISLYIETIIRPEGWHLYGFTAFHEQEWFHLLLSVQGVGARMALALLSRFKPEELAQAIIVQDKAALCQADGIGPKLAQRIVTELNDKVRKMNGGMQSLMTTPTSLGGPSTYRPSSVEDASLALQALGYKPHEFFPILNRLTKEQDEKDLTVEKLVKSTLQQLAVGQT